MKEDVVLFLLGFCFYIVSSTSYALNMAFQLDLVFLT